MQGGRPKVSVIVPIYNTIAFVEGCIRSVMAQSLRELEILLIDDGSTDGCAGVCDRLAAEDERIRVVHKANQGSAAARNEGIRLATGEYIAFVESDDQAEPGLYTRLVAMADQTNADLVKCDYYRVTHGSKQPVQAMAGVAREGEVFQAVDRPQIFMRHASIWAGLYRRAFLTEFNLTFIETPAATYSDFSFMAATYAKARHIAVVHAPLYDYSYDNPASSRVRQGEKCCYKPFHCMEANRMLREAGIFDRVKEEIGYQEYRTCLSHARLIREDVRSQYFQKMREALTELTSEGFTYARFRPWEKQTMQLVLTGKEARFYRRAAMERKALAVLERLEGSGDLTGKLKRMLKKDGHR